MTKLKLLLGLGVLMVIGVVGSGAALASPPGPWTCSGGTEGSPTLIPAGTYNKGLVVTGICMFAGDAVTINGGLTVKPGAILNDHAGSTTTARVNGGVFVGEGAVLGLGQYGAPGIKTDTRVNGGIVADRPLSLYLSGITVNGNVTSVGGVTVTAGPVGAFRNFPFKDNKVNGNLTIQGWEGGWLGVIRDHVNGNVNVSGNSSVLVLVPSGCDENTPPTCTGTVAATDTDSTEVQTNVIHGNLACYDNTPQAQVNALDGGQPNQVTGRKLGECSGL